MLLHRLLPVLILTALLSTACSGERHPEGASFPLSIRYAEGDDGLITNTLRLTQKGGRITASEATSDNFSGLQQRSDTLRTDSLSAVQLRYLDGFLRAAFALPEACPQPSSLEQELTVDQPGSQKTIRGNCAWGKADYHALRKVLFGDRAR